MNGPPPPPLHHMTPMEGMNHQGMNPKIEKITGMFDGMNISTKYDTKVVVDSRGNLPTTYHGYIFQKAEPDFGQPRTWARVVRNEMPISNNDLLDRVKKHQRKGVSVLKQFESQTATKRTQIDRLLDEKRKVEKDPRYEWTLASLTTEEKNVGRTGKETVSMQVILRRQQKKGVGLAKNDQKGHTGVIVDIHAPKKETKNQQGDRQNHPQNHGLFGQAGNGGMQNMDGFFQQARHQDPPPPPPPPPMMFEDRFPPPHQGLNMPKKDTNYQQDVPGFQGDRPNHPQNQGLFGQVGNGGIPNMDPFLQQNRHQGAPPPPPPPPMTFNDPFPPPHPGIPGPQGPGMNFPNVMRPQMSQESQPPMFAYGSNVKKAKGKKAKHDHGDHGDFSSGSGFDSDRSAEAKHKRRHSKSKTSKGKGDKRTRNWASGRSDSFSEPVSDSDTVWDSDDNASIITPNSSNSSEARRDQKRHSADHRDYHHRASHGRSRERERDVTRRHHRTSPQPGPKIVVRDIYEEEPRRNRHQRYEEDYTIVEPNRSRRLLGRRMTTGYSTERPPPARHSGSYDVPDARDRRPRYPPGSSYPRVTRRLPEIPHPADRYADEELDDLLYRERVDRRGNYTEGLRRRSEVYTEGPRRREEVYMEGPRRRGEFFVDEEY